MTANCNVTGAEPAGRSVQRRRRDLDRGVRAQQRRTGMMTFAKEIAVWLVLWIGGCVVFDALLGLTGGWLMLGGVITYEVCSAVQDRMRSNAKNQGDSGGFIAGGSPGLPG